MYKDAGLSFGKALMTAMGKIEQSNLKIIESYIYIICTLVTQCMKIQTEFTAAVD